MEAWGNRKDNSLSLVFRRPQNSYNYARKVWVPFSYLEAPASGREKSC